MLAATGCVATASVAILRTGRPPSTPGVVGLLVTASLAAAWYYLPCSHSWRGSSRPACSASDLTTANTPPANRLEAHRASRAHATATAFSHTAHLRAYTTAAARHGATPGSQTLPGGEPAKGRERSHACRPLPGSICQAVDPSDVRDRLIHCEQACRFQAPSQGYKSGGRLSVLRRLPWCSRPPDHKTEPHAFRRAGSRERSFRPKRPLSTSIGRCE
jgi:hypothetical protein